MNYKTKTVVFSKNRAMQLDCCLTTLHKQCQDISNLNISVLYTTTNDLHEKSYNILKKDYPNINFVKENNFQEDLLNIVLGSTHILFCVDDTIFTDQFFIADMVDALEYPHNEYVLGVSLRLGKNTVHCYPLDKNQLVPNFMNGWFGFNKFDWTKGTYDFNYPLDLSSSMYRKKDLNFILKHAEYNNPNQLEHLLHINANMYDKNYLLCFKTSVAFSNPTNRVQEVNNNKFAFNGYSPEFLLDLFLEGFRIETTGFEDFISDGCHEEIEYLFIGKQGANK